MIVVSFDFQLLERLSLRENKIKDLPAVIGRDKLMYGKDKDHFIHLITSAFKTSLHSMKQFIVNKSIVYINLAKMIYSVILNMYYIL